MRRFWRRCLVILGIVVVTYSVLLAGRWWASSQEFYEFDRSFLYGRALESAVAERAAPTTPSAFQHVLPYTTPEEQRPPGADPQAFIGTAPASLPCLRTAAQMRKEGPGECSSVYPGSDRRQQPRLCEFLPCTVVVVDPVLWNDPATRPAFSGRGLRERMCAIREAPAAMDWPRDPRRLPDCGPWWFTRGLGFVAVPHEDNGYDFHRIF